MRFLHCLFCPVVLDSKSATHYIHRSAPADTPLDQCQVNQTCSILASPRLSPTENGTATRKARSGGGGGGGYDRGGNPGYDRPREPRRDEAGGDPGLSARTSYRAARAPEDPRGGGRPRVSRRERAWERGRRGEGGEGDGDATVCIREGFGGGYGGGKGEDLAQRSVSNGLCEETPHDSTLTRSAGLDGSNARGVPRSTMPHHAAPWYLAADEHGPSPMTPAPRPARTAVVMVAGRASAAAARAAARPHSSG